MVCWCNLERGSGTSRQSRGNPWQSAVIRRNLWQSVAIRGNPRFIITQFFALLRKDAALCNNRVDPARFGRKQPKKDCKPLTKDLVHISTQTLRDLSCWSNTLSKNLNFVICWFFLKIFFRRKRTSDLVASSIESFQRSWWCGMCGEILINIGKWIHQ